MVAHDPGRVNRPEIDTQADTQSDTLRSGRPCDSWTPLEAKVREFLSKTHRWTPSDAGGSAETDLLIRVSLVRSQRGPPIESISYEDLVSGLTSVCQHFVPRLDALRLDALRLHVCTKIAGLCGVPRPGLLVATVTRPPGGGAGPYYHTDDLRPHCASGPAGLCRSLRTTLHEGVVPGVSTRSSGRRRPRRPNTRGLFGTRTDDLVVDRADGRLCPGVHGRKALTIATRVPSPSCSVSPMRACVRRNGLAAVSPLMLPKVARRWQQEIRLPVQLVVDDEHAGRRDRLPRALTTPEATVRISANQSLRQIQP